MLIRKFFNFILWLIFLFVLLEIAGFIYFKLGVSKPISGHGYPAGLIVSHPELGYLYQPGFKGYFKGTAYHQIPIHINSDGFRDDDFSKQTTDQRRWAILGDSVVFGPGVTKEERFTECLEQKLSHGDNELDILNLGVNSYTFGHYLKIAELGYMDTAPDAVLIGITLNDFRPMDDSGIMRRLKRHEEEYSKPIWFERLQERLAKTYAGEFIDELKTRFSYAMMNADETEAYHTKWMRSVVKAWSQAENAQRFARELSQFKALMDASGTPYAFILFPELNDIKEPSKYDSPRKLVLRELQARNLQYCDPYDAFANEENPDRFFLQRDSVHFNPEGNTLLCNAILRCFERGDISLTP